MFKANIYFIISSHTKIKNTVKYINKILLISILILINQLYLIIILISRINFDKFLLVIYKS